MRIAGIDLASQDPNTALCVLEDDRVAVLRVGVGDEELLAAARSAALTGIDAPLGWPAPFTAALASYARTGRWPTAAGAAELRRLRLRTTDVAVHRRTGKTPLSVSTDSIGVCATRAARLLTALADGAPVDRVGGRMVEVYPGASLVPFGLAAVARGYKRDAEVRARLLAALPVRLGDDDRALAATVDHATDAILSALVARARACGLTHPVEGPEDVVAEEGWIHLPVDDALPRLFA